MILKIYIRDDLNMRRGKMASQCAHAGLKYFMDICNLSGNKLIMSHDSLIFFRNWIKKGKLIEVIPVSSEMNMVDIISKHKEECVFIEDIGRTEFKGVKTMTSVAVIENVNYKVLIKNKIQKINSESKRNQKQAIVANKKIKMDKFKFSKYATLISIESIMSDFLNKSEINLRSKGLINWLTENFAKITLQSKKEEMDLLLSKLKSNDDINYAFLNYENDDIFMIAIGGDDAEKVDKYTKDFKLF